MSQFFDINASKERCVKYRKAILKLSQQVPALHIGPAFSCLEIVDVIYHALMRRDKNNKYLDSFILSKGHGCAVQYIVLHDLGFLNDNDMRDFCLPGGQLGAHPDYGIPGVEASTGSLGHGLGLAVGICYANKLSGSDAKTYVVISDGELQEGSCWEAIMMAANLKLDNLTVFLDLNDRTSLDKLSETHTAFYPVVDKLLAFNWDASELDGHDSASIFQVASQKFSGKPRFVVCNTQKGKGVSFMEDVAIWHYRSPNKEEYQQAINELDANIQEVFA